MQMQIQIFSDIHLELLKTLPEMTKTADILILAGDIGKVGCPLFKPFFDMCATTWTNTFYILGNHEYYHNSKTWNHILEEYTNFFNGYKNVHLLNNSAVDLDSQYVIYGTTLWSKVSCTIGLNDFKGIKIKNEKGWTVGLSRDKFLEWHMDSVNKLVEFVKNSNKKIIMVTHFPPLRKTKTISFNTSDPKYDTQSEYLQHYFANNFVGQELAEYETTESDLYPKICLWVSGHTHYSYDFRYQGTRFVANQKGYTTETGKTGYSTDGTIVL